MIILSDCHTLYLEKIANSENIKITHVGNFTTDIDEKILSHNGNLLLLLSQTIYNTFYAHSFDSNLIFRNRENLLNQIENVVELFKKDGREIIIPLIPTHYLFCENYGWEYSSQISHVQNILLMNSLIIQRFTDDSYIKIIKGIGHVEKEICKDYFRFSSIYNDKNSRIIINQIKNLNINSSRIQKKLIILDLDNTLWKGTIGDDGIEGIIMDKSDPIGSIYYFVQNRLLQLKKRGFLLAICSKNDEKLALSGLFDHESSILKRDDVVTYRINWERKSKNINEIVDELNISLKDTIFIDDSPQECDEVRSECEGITVLKVPKNIYKYPEMILEEKALYTSIPTDEDKNRTKLYKDRLKRNFIIKDSIKTKISKNQWVKNLEMKIQFSTLSYDSMNLSRIVQLFNRTNQFHLSGNRYSSETIIKSLKQKNNFYYYSIASDKYGSEGLISVIGLSIAQSHLTVNDYILSCRVFGRYIENFMLIPTLELSKTLCKPIKFNFKRTGRNDVIYSFIKKLTDDKYIIPMETVNILLSKFYKIPIEKTGFVNTLNVN